MPRSLKDPKKAKKMNKGGAKKGEGSSSSLNGMSLIPGKCGNQEMSPQQTIKHQCGPSTNSSHENNVEKHHNRNGPDDPDRVTRILLNNYATMKPPMRVPSKYQDLTSLIKERITLALRYFIELSESNNKISPTDQARCNAQLKDLMISSEMCVALLQMSLLKLLLQLLLPEAQAMWSVRNSSGMLEEATATGTTILAKYLEQRDRSKRVKKIVSMYSRMSTLVFVGIEIFTKADGAQSSRVPVPLPEDPYEAIRHAYLVGTDTESEPFESEIEAPKSPRTVVSPTSLPDSTPPTCHVEGSEGSDTSDARSMSSDFIAPLSPDHPLTHTTPTFVPILRRTARIVVRIPPMAEVSTMSDSTFCKRFRSSYESLPSSSPPDIPSRKHYQGTSELVEDHKDADDDDDEEEDEDEEIDESLDFNSVSEGVENEGPTAEDDPATRDEGLAAGDEVPSMGVEGLSLGGDEAVPGSQ
nr:membrin-11-like [Tanacetum cinerariifolium]